MSAATDFVAAGPIDLEKVYISQVQNPSKKNLGISCDQDNVALKIIGF